MKRFVRRSCRAVQGLAPVVLGILAVSLVGLWGCGSRVPSGTVSGKAMVGAEPLSEADVLFCREDGAAIAKATVGPSGSFTFAEPVPVGKYRVQIESTVQMAPPESGKTQPPPKLKFPAKYQDNRTSGLTAEVKAGDNSFTFELK